MGAHQRLPPAGVDPFAPCRSKGMLSSATLGDPSAPNPKIEAPLGRADQRGNLFGKQGKVAGVFKKIDVADQGSQTQRLVALCAISARERGEEN